MLAGIDGRIKVSLGLVTCISRPLDSSKWLLSATSSSSCAIKVFQVAVVELMVGILPAVLAGATD